MRLLYSIYMYIQLYSAKCINDVALNKKIRVCLVSLTLTVPVTAIDALQHFETG